jgi:NADP-dependent 3-hydroxy acid dehydrogenase YdfG
LQKKGFKEERVTTVGLDDIGTSTTLESNKSQGGIMAVNIEGKVVVITGASSGLGESTARLLAASGAKVALGARRKDRIDALVKDITAKGGSAIGFKTDVTKRSDVEALVKGAMDKYGRIDVIVNNAGIMPIAPLAALKVEEWDRMIDVNIKGLLYGVAAALPIMQKQKQGHIINIASVAGFKVFAPGGAVYSATKFAVRAVTEGLRMEHKADNIRATIISPGAVASELPESSSEEATRENMREFYKIAIPADSIARAIAYAIEQPAEVEIDEIVIRPTALEF